MERRALTDAEVTLALNDLDGWQLVNGKLHKTYNFSSFAKAMGWMMSCAIEADKMDHHPEWSNVYNRVTVDFVTHDLDNAISSWDIALAESFDALL